MTVSTTLCCASFHDRLRRVVIRFAVLLLSLAAAPAHADEATIRYAEIVPDRGQYVINADVSVTLAEPVIDALDEGIPINFVAEAAIDEPRWYWFDDTLVTAVLEFRLSYHPMTRSYRLAIGSLHQTFDSLDAALQTMQRIRRWPITDMQRLTPGQSYKVQVRFRLDTSLLPRPFQVSTLGNGDWETESDWLRWTFLASPLPRQ